MTFALLRLFLLLPNQVVASQPERSEIPILLREAFEQRQSFKTASWELRQESSQEGFAPIVNNKLIEWAGESFFCRDEGSDDGMLRYQDARSGEIPLGVVSSFCPEERVVDGKTGALWARSINSPFTTLTSKDAWRDFVDSRSLGLRSFTMQRLSPKEMLKLLRDPDGLRFQPIIVRDGLATIIGVGSPRVDGAYYEYEWVIDKEKGPSILVSRQHLRNPGGSRILESEARCSLGQIDGRWWPIRVEFDYPRVNGHSVYEFRKVEFDLPQHPKRIDADLMGLPIGAPVILQGLNRTDRYMGTGATIDDESWKKIKGEYDRTPYREFSNRALAFGRGEFPVWWSSTDGTEGIRDVSVRPDLWEAYVRRWVMRRSNHGLWHVIEPLTDAQRATAKGILDECRNRGVPIRSRLDKEATEVATGLAAAETALKTLLSANDKASESAATVPEARKTAPDSGARKDKAVSEQELNDKIRALQQRKAELAKSPEIERIFDELKARLEGMLTSKQKDPGNASFQRPTPPPLPQAPPGARPMIPPPAPTSSRPATSR